MIREIISRSSSRQGRMVLILLSCRNRGFRAGINLAFSSGSPVKKSGEEIPQILPCFETDARDLRRGRDALRNDLIVPIAAEGLETERVDLGTAEPKRGDDVEAKEMAAMRPERRARPAALFEHLDNLQVARQAVTMDGIEKEDVSVTTQSAVPIEQIGLCRGEQRFAGGDRRGIAPCDCGEGFEIQRIADIFEPPEPERRKQIRRLDAACGRVGVYRVDGKMIGTVEESRRDVDALQILSQWRAADLDLGAPIAEIAKAADLIGKTTDIVGGVVISASGVDWRACHFGAGSTIRQKPVKQQLRNLRRSIPERHIQRSDCDAPLAVATRLFAAHHDLPRAERVEVCPCIVHEINVTGGQQTGREPLPNETTLCEAADRGKAVPDNRLAIPANPTSPIRPCVLRFSQSK